jgi:hypothetical protein
MPTLPTGITWALIPSDKPHPAAHLEICFHSVFSTDFEAADEKVVATNNIRLAS